MLGVRLHVDGPKTSEALRRDMQTTQIMAISTRIEDTDSPIGVRFQRRMAGE